MPVLAWLAAPTGLPVVDALLVLAVAAGAVAAAARSARWALVVAAAIATVATLPAPAFALLAAAGGALAVAVPRLRAVGGAAVVVALFTIPWAHPSGLSAVVGAVAVAVLVAGAWPNLAEATRRRVRRGAVAAGVLVAGAVVLLGVAGAVALSPLLDGSDLARAGLDAAGDGEEEQAAVALDAAAERFGAAHRMLASPLSWPARLVPGLAPHARALVGMSDTGRELARAGADAVREADVQAVTATAGRIDPAEVAALGPPLVDSAAALTRAEDRLAGLASPWLVEPLAGLLRDLDDEVRSARDSAETAALAADVVPGLLGADGPRRYLVAFVTPAEGRGAGGFFGNYAELEAVDGKVDMTLFGRHDDLTALLALAGGPPPGVEEVLDAYLPDPPFPDLPFQRATVPPDLPEAAGVLTALWDRLGGKPLDGVIEVDPRGIAALLALTGPITVEGLDEPLTSENAADVLLRRQYLELPDRGERLDVLDGAARTTFERLTTGDLPGPRTVVDALTPAVRSGGLQVYVEDPDEQALFDRIGAGGAIAPVTSDFVELVHQNAAPNKVDTFLERSLRYDAEVDEPTGEVEATATITLTNATPPEALVDHVASNMRDEPIGTNIAEVLLFTPLDVVDATVDGRPVAVRTERLLGRNAHAVRVLVPAGLTATVEMRLAGTVDTGDGYHLDVGRQPVVTPDQLGVEVRTGGRTVRWSGELTEPLRLG